MAYDRIRDDVLTLEELLQELRRKSRDFDIEITGSQLTGLNVFDQIALQVERIFKEFKDEDKWAIEKKEIEEEEAQKMNIDFNDQNIADLFCMH